MTSFSFSSMIRRTAAGLMAFGLAACGFNGAEEAQFGVQQRHPITVDPEVVTMMIDVEPAMVQLSAEDADRVSAFAAQYRQRGHGPLSVAAPSGSPNQQAALAVVSSVKEALDEASIQEAALDIGTYRASRAHETAPIILSFRRYVATASPCGDWSDNWSTSYRNLPTSGFGCATQNNLAAMISEPRDLMMPRDMDPADARRRDQVLKGYREGEVTGTERTAEESGTLSEVGQ